MVSRMGFSAYGRASIGEDLPHESYRFVAHKFCDVDLYEILPSGALAVDVCGDGSM